MDNNETYKVYGIERRCNILYNMRKSGDFYKFLKFFYSTLLKLNKIEVADFWVNYSIKIDWAEKNDEMWIDGGALIITKKTKGEEVDPKHISKKFYQMAITDLTCTYCGDKDTINLDSMWLICFKDYITRTNSPLRLEWLKYLIKDLSNKPSEERDKIISQLFKDKKELDEFQKICAKETLIKNKKRKV